LSDGRPKFREDVHALVLSHDLVVLDAWSGIELLEGHLSSALAHSLKEDPAVPQMIAHAAHSLDTLDAVYEVEELRRRGLLAAGEPAGGEPFVELVADYLDPRLEDVNRQALEAGRPWMLARPRGPVVWLGPVFVPGRGPCWACMAARLRDVRAAWRLPERRAGGDAPVVQLGLDLAALEAARWKRHPHGPARLLTFDTQSLAQREHAVVRRRDCPACGDPAARTASPPLALQSRRKSFTLDGGHRAVPPEQTYARYAHLVSPLTGIVHDVRRADGDPGAFNTFVARHNFQMGSTGKRIPPSRSYGKGMTADQARTGALCEALERYSGVLRGDEPLLRATFRDLGGEAIHPNACLGVSERQYDGREAWNRHAPRAMWIPDPFDDEQETDWVAAWSLTHARKRYVAVAYCYYGYRTGPNHFARADSNGSAAGTCLEDAILQGLLELIERDAAGIWWYGRHPRPGVVLDTPYGKAMTHEYAARGRELRLLDLTTDIGIPACAALSFGAEPDVFGLGFGTHLDPTIAVTRAITEANQLLAINRRAPRLYRGALADRSFLEPHGFHEMSTAAPPSDDLRDDVAACVGVLAGLGLEVLVLDQTREEVGLPVVKVIVPGLRHFRPRFAPGRLYDVPRRLGWVEQALREEELNPAHLTI
jgi:bacteriocin biosynthesis cyclodehydratase domain-containing protein